MSKYMGDESFDTSTVTNASGMHSNEGVNIYNQGKQSFASNEEVSSNLQNQADWQQGVQGAYTDEQKKVASSGQYGVNQAKDPTSGRLNQKSYEDTLYASRLADALNNRRFYYGHQGGIGTRGFNSNRAAGAIDLRDSKRIETQEMRQMRADEGIDNYMRQRAAGLSADAAAHSLDIQKQADSSVQNLATLFGMNQADMAKQYQMLNATYNWANPTALAQSLYSQRAQQITNAMIGEELGNKYMTMMRRTPMLANLISGRLGMQAFDRYSALLELAMDAAGVTDPTEQAKLYAKARADYDQIAKTLFYSNATPRTMYGQDMYIENKFDKQTEASNKAHAKAEARREKRTGGNA